MVKIITARVQASVVFIGNDIIFNIWNETYYNTNYNATISSIDRRLCRQ